MALSVVEARERRVCRICEEPISVTNAPVGWTHEFGKLVYPIRVTLNFGQEFAHTDCLEDHEKSSPKSTIPLYDANAFEPLPAETLAGAPTE